MWRAGELAGLEWRGTCPKRPDGEPGELLIK